LDYESKGDIGAAFEAMVGWLVKAALGKLLGPVGTVLFIAIEVVSLISTALVPGGRSSVGRRTLELTTEEYD
jgi:hypothetical protein